MLRGVGEEYMRADAKAVEVYPGFRKASDQPTYLTNTPNNLWSPPKAISPIIDLKRFQPNF